MGKVVLYHAECNDGIMAAAIVAHFEKDPSIVYHPVKYGSTLPNIPPDTELMIVDFCFDLGTMLNLLENTKSLSVIDHHESARKTLAALEASREANDNLRIVFAEDDCGASAVWKMYSELTQETNPAATLRMPKAIRHVRNHDLHKKTIEDDYFFYGVMTHDQTISFWQSLIEDDTTDAIIVKGTSIYNFIKYTFIPQQRTKVFYTKVPDHGYIIPVVNVNRVLRPLILEELVKTNLVAISYEDSLGNRREWSIRSCDKEANGAALKIAHHFGGGGHSNSAGFVTDTSFQLPVIA